MAEPDARQALLELMAKWHQLADQIDTFNGANTADLAKCPFPPASWQNTDKLLKLQHHQAGMRSVH